MADDESVARVRQQVEQELLLFHPELRTALISNEQRVKLACVLEALVREVIEDVLAKKGKP